MGEKNQFAIGYDLKGAILLEMTKKDVLCLGKGVFTY